jgi:mannan endo-1,4-beta-mannosidase
LATTLAIGGGPLRPALTAIRSSQRTHATNSPPDATAHAPQATASPSESGIGPYDPGNRPSPDWRPSARPSNEPTADATPTATPTATGGPTPAGTPTPPAPPTPSPTPAGPPTPTPQPPAPTPPPGFVVRSGGQLWLAGQPFRFTGLNIYNANSINNCWYTLGTGSGLDGSLTSLNGAQQVFRAWFFQREATINGVRDWSAFDHTLAVAAAHGQRVIATLGNQWGECEDAIYKSEAWYQGGYRSTVAASTIEPYRAWVAEVVSHYRNNPTIMAWQLINEAEDATVRGGACSATAVASLYNFTADVGALVKSIDSNHLLNLGTIGSGQCGASGTAYQYVHSVPAIDLCEYHDYSGPNVLVPGDAWNGLAVRISQCRALGKPLFVGEMGLLTSQTGTVAARASAFSAKVHAQFTSGVVGELLWDWRAGYAGGSSPTGYEIGPSDPAIGILRVG